MCGINGILRLDPDAPEIDGREIAACRDMMRHRGPDGSGAWSSADGRAALGHRRLAILDLSPAGAQPMTSADGRFTIVTNGEIYNFRELRTELEAQGARFRSQSDTEVVLALYERHGAGMLSRLRGMFALALWDEAAATLLLARNPLGIKPLYYAEAGKRLLFASQVRALEAAGVSREIDPAGLAGFLLWGAVPEPWTLRRAIKALPAGCFLLARGGKVEEPRAYFRAEREPLAPPLSPQAGRGGRNGIAALADALERSVAAHLVSDVPVAVFLSAGLDSSLIAALAARRVAEPLTTFTLSFDLFAGTALDEGPLAAATAARLGTRHLERRVGKADFAGLWGQALAAMDQPSIDGFNTFLVSRLAHEQGVKVALSGLGGDELLGSYPSFTEVPRIARWARRARRLPGASVLWRFAAGRLFPHRPKLSRLGELGATLPGAYLLRRGLFLPDGFPGLLGAERAREALAAYDPLQDAEEKLVEAPRLAVERGAEGDPALAVHLLESGLYMRNQLLRDADWASMAHSLELRVPLADAFLYQEATALGLARFHRLGKAAVVRAVAPELPPALFSRPKSGFYLPVAEWSTPAGAAPPASRAEGSRRLALAVLAELGSPSMLEEILGRVAGERTRRWAAILAAYFSTQSLAQLLSLSAGLVFVHSLPMGEFALYSLAASVVALFAFLTDLGATTSLLYFYQRSRREAVPFEPYLAAVAGLRRWAFLLGALPVLIALPWVAVAKGFPRGAAWLAAFAVLANVWSQILASLRLLVLRLKGQFGRSYKAEIAGAAARLLLALLLVALALLHAWLALVTSAAALAVTVILARPEERWQAPGADLRRHRREILRYLTPTLPSALYFSIQSQLVVWLAATFGSTRNIAEVGALGRLGMVMALFSNLTSVVFLPRLAQITDEALYRRRSLQFATLMLLVAGALLAASALVPDLFLLVLGPNYRGLYRELLLVVANAGLILLGGYFVAVNAARSWNRLQAAALGVQLAAQILLAVVVPLSTTTGVLLFGTASSAVALALQACITFLGFYRPTWAEWR